jgi:hypothetical protein
MTNDEAGMANGAKDAGSLFVIRSFGHSFVIGISTFVIFSEAP